MAKYRKEGGEPSGKTERSELISRPPVGHPLYTRDLHNVYDSAAGPRMTQPLSHGSALGYYSQACVP